MNNNKKNNNMNENELRIEKVRKNSEGDITDVMLSNGDAYSIKEVINMAKNGQISEVNVSRAKNGREYLKSNPNGSESDNLSNKPLF